MLFAYLLSDHWTPYGWMGWMVLRVDWRYKNAKLCVSWIDKINESIKSDCAVDCECGAGKTIMKHHNILLISPNEITKMISNSIVRIWYINYDTQTFRSFWWRRQRQRLRRRQQDNHSTLISAFKWNGEKNKNKNKSIEMKVFFFFVRRSFKLTWRGLGSLFLTLFKRSFELPVCEFLMTLSSLRIVFHLAKLSRMTIMCYYSLWNYAYAALISQLFNGWRVRFSWAPFRHSNFDFSQMKHLCKQLLNYLRNTNRN